MLSVNNSPEATRLWFYKKSGIFLHHFCYPAGRLDSLLHMHDEYNIIFCLSGVFEYCIRDTCERVEPGDLLVINPGEMHHGRYGCGVSDSTGLTLHVTERAIKEMMHRMRLLVDVERSSVSFLGKVNVPALFPLAHELLSVLEERQHGYEMVAEALVVQFVVRLLRDCLHPVVQLRQRVLSRQLPSWQMVRALEYMNARGKSSFSLVELCSTVGTGATRFIQLFKNSVSNGMSPHLFYNHLIVSKAKRLLREPAFSVKRGFLRARFPEREPLLQGVSGLHGIDPQRFPPFRAGLLPGDSRLHPSLIVFCRPGQQNEISYNCSLWAQGLHARCACYKW